MFARVFFIDARSLLLSRSFSALRRKKIGLGEDLGCFKGFPLFPDEWRDDEMKGITVNGQRSGLRRF